MAKSKSISPTQGTLVFCRKRGWLVDITEKWIPSLRPNSQGEMELQLFGNRKDLFGSIDLLAVRNGRMLAIRTTSGSNNSARVKKIARECGVAAAGLLRANVEIEVWAWRKLATRVDGCLWQPLITPVTLEDVLAAEPLADEVLDRDAGPPAATISAAAIVRAIRPLLMSSSWGWVWDRNRLL